MALGGGYWAGAGGSVAPAGGYKALDGGSMATIGGSVAPAGGSVTSAGVRIGVLRIPDRADCMDYKNTNDSNDLNVIDTTVILFGRLLIIDMLSYCDFVHPIKAVKAGSNKCIN